MTENEKQAAGPERAEEVQQAQKPADENQPGAPGVLDEEDDATATGNLVIVVVIILVLVVVWLFNKLWKKDDTAMPPAGQTPAANVQQPAQQSQQPSGPAAPTTYAERRTEELKRVRGMMFKQTGDAGNRYIVAIGPRPKQVEGNVQFVEGELFDVTKTAEGFDIGDLVPCGFKDNLAIPTQKNPIILKMLGTPDLTAPRFMKAAEATFLRDDEDFVLGIVIDGEARAYPCNILSHHFLIYDTVAQKKVVVIFNGFTFASSAFKTNIGDHESFIGFAGRLYRGNIVLYDDKTGSLWDSLEGAALTGACSEKGLSLEAVPVEAVKWGWWKKQHPDTTVLSMETGAESHVTQMGASYMQNFLDQAAGYYRSDALFSTVPYYDPKTSPLGAKEIVFGVHTPGGNRAYKRTSLINLQEPIKDKIGNVEITVAWNAEKGVPDFQADGKPIAAMPMLWFGWRACNAETDVYQDPVPDSLAPKDDAKAAPAPTDAQPAPVEPPKAP
ncbi:MAG TPA: DUF3179 domain-containing (seleno)protein [Candidatus Brocadiia bacterium]|nr:DUF3179 domain-containing (seleno)protein [Candidatus Brocadiia bacterium]